MKSLPQCNVAKQNLVFNHVGNVAVHLDTSTINFAVTHKQ